jgi:mannose-6-phosphate isomerase-like protein (cupin superfamily)
MQLRISTDSGELDITVVHDVLKGRMRIEMEDRTIELCEGDMYVVPKGVRHNPSAIEKCHVLLIERKTTLHTGDVITEQTRSIAEQLGRQ